MVQRARILSFCRHRPTEFCKFGALCDHYCISLAPVKRLLWSRATAGKARRRGPRAGWEDACVGRSLLMYCVGDTDERGDLFFLGPLRIVCIQQNENQENKNKKYVISPARTAYGQAPTRPRRPKLHVAARDILYP